MITRRLAVAIGLLCAVLGAQWPEFAQQYRQRLGGALDELNRAIAEFDQQAQRQSLTREQGLQRLERNDDPLARQRADAITEDLSRAERLSRQKQAFAAIRDAVAADIEPRLRAMNASMEADERRMRGV